MNRRKLEIDAVFPGEAECSIRIVIRGDVEVVGVAAGRNVTSELCKLIWRSRLREVWKMKPARC